MVLNGQPIKLKTRHENKKKYSTQIDAILRVKHGLVFLSEKLM